MGQVIYLMTFPNGKHYVGRTRDFDSRMIEHKYRSTKKNTHLYNAIKKYGWDNVKKEIIDTADSLTEAIAKEYEWIVKYDTIRTGYNITSRTDYGGDVWANRRSSEEFVLYKEKMKLVNSGENNGMYGKKQKDETKDKMKAKAKGRFSLPWFIERYGEVEGTVKYNDRCLFLKSRNMLHASNGCFSSNIK